MRGQIKVKRSPIAREVFDNIQERTLPAGTRVEVPVISADLTSVSSTWVGRTGTVVGDVPEVVWSSMGWPSLVAWEVLHEVLFDGDAEPVAISDLRLVRSDRPVLSAKERFDRLPEPLRNPDRQVQRYQPNPIAQVSYNEIQARRWKPGTRCAVTDHDAFGAPWVGEGVVQPGPVQVQWTDTDELYERPYAVMHPVLFDGEAEPVMVSDRRMTDGQDNRHEHARATAGG